MIKMVKILLLLGLFSITTSTLAATAITTTTNNGTVSGTAITYTITPTGTAREIFSPNSSDNGTWSWSNGFPEFVGTDGQTLTVTFSAPVPISKIVFGINSASTPFTLTISGGTAMLADFNLSDSISSIGGAAGASYNGGTGVITPTGSDQGLIVGSSSNNTISQFSLSGNNGGDGYTLFFGTVDFVASSPTPASVDSLLFSLLALIGIIAIAGFFSYKQEIV